jgi:hypothetical protein
MDSSTLPPSEERHPSFSYQETLPKRCSNLYPKPALCVMPIKTGSGRTRGTTINSPTFADLLKTNSEDNFANLKGGGNTILQNKPNHMMIGPAVFMIADGVQCIQDKTLAYRIICKINKGADEASSADTASNKGSTTILTKMTTGATKA